MSINSIGGGASTWRLTSASGQNVSSGHGVGGPRGHGKSPIDVAARALGMSTDDLTSELAQNKSLDDVATEKGVAHDDLVAALKAGMPKDGPAATESTSETDTRIESMTIRKGGPKPPPGPARSREMQGMGQSTGVFGSAMTSQQSDLLESLSSLLGTSSDDLVSQLKSGTSLASMVSSKGVSSSSLAQVLQDGLLLDTKA